MKPGELTRDTFPILHQQFGRPCRGYISYFEQGAQTICLRCITLDPKERRNWPRQRVTKTRVIGTLQFGSDTALCNEVRPLSILQVQFHSNCKKEECNIVRPPSSLDLPASFHNSECILMLFNFMPYTLSHRTAAAMTYLLTNQQKCSRSRSGDKRYSAH